MSLLPMDDHLYTTGRCCECGGTCQPRYERCDTCLVRIARCFNAVDRAVKGSKNPFQIHRDAA